MKQNKYDLLRLRQKILTKQRKGRENMNTGNHKKERGKGNDILSLPLRVSCLCGCV